MNLANLCLIILLSVFLKTKALSEIDCNENLLKRNLQSDNQSDIKANSELQQWSNKIADALNLPNSKYWSLEYLAQLPPFEINEDSNLDEYLKYISTNDFTLSLSKVLHLKWMSTSVNSPEPTILSLPYLSQREVKLSKLSFYSLSNSSNHEILIIFYENDKIEKGLQKPIFGVTIPKQSFTELKRFHYVIEAKQGDWFVWDVGFISQFENLYLKINSIGDLTHISGSVNASTSHEIHTDTFEIAKLSMKSSGFPSTRFWKTAVILLHQFMSLVIYVMLWIVFEFVFNRERYYSISRLWKWGMYIVFTTVLHLQLKIAYDSNDYIFELLEIDTFKILLLRVTYTIMLFGSVIVPFLTPNVFLSEGTDPQGWDCWFIWLVLWNTFYYIFLHFLYYYRVIDFCAIMDNIFLNPVIYFAVSSWYAMMIILNAVFKTRHFGYQFLTMFLLSIYLCSYPYMPMGASALVPGFNYWIIDIALFINLWLCLTLYAQLQYGSRFFLPSMLRTNRYEPFVQLLEDHPEDMQYECDLCLNLLSDAELEYFNKDNKKQEFVEMQKTRYYRLLWNHKYHILWLTKTLKSTANRCSKCDGNIPDYEYDD